MIIPRRHPISSCHWKIAELAELAEREIFGTRRTDVTLPAVGAYLRYVVPE
jgi:hypothetical protein